MIRTNRNILNLLTHHYKHYNKPISYQIASSLSIHQYYSHSSLSIHQYYSHCTTLPSTFISYPFSTIKSSQSTTQKSSQILQLFSSKMNKYNIKSLIKMYLIIHKNNLVYKLNEQTIKQFQQRIVEGISQLDHYFINVVLDIVLLKNQRYYKINKNDNDKNDNDKKDNDKKDNNTNNNNDNNKSNNTNNNNDNNKSNNKSTRTPTLSPLHRCINTLILKSRLSIIPQHCYPTFILLSSLNFPLLTITKFISNLVIQLQPTKRLFTFIPLYQSLKLTSYSLQIKQISIQIKKRLLECIIKVKVKQNNLKEIVYYWKVWKNVIQNINETIKYQSQKRKVYELAFNPYSWMVEKNNQKQQKQIKQNNNSQNNNNSRKQSHINQQILSQLTQKKQFIEKQYLSKINLLQLQQQIITILSNLNKSSQKQQQQQYHLTFKQQKQLLLILISENFILSNEQNRNKILIFTDFIIKLLNKSLSSSQNQHINIIKVTQFIIFIDLLTKYTPQISQIQSYLTQYMLKFMQFMNLQQKLILILFQNRILSKQINLISIKNIIQQVNYSINQQQFNLLINVIKKGKKQNENVKQEILNVIEQKLDEEKNKKQ